MARSSHHLLLLEAHQRVIVRRSLLIRRFVPCVSRCIRTRSLAWLRVAGLALRGLLRGNLFVRWQRGRYDWLCRVKGRLGASITFLSV